jgi:hypothetical protein
MAFSLPSPPEAGKLSSFPASQLSSFMASPLPGLSLLAISYELSHLPALLLYRFPQKIYGKNLYYLVLLL